MNQLAEARPASESDVAIIPASNGAGALLNIIAHAAENPQVDVTKLSALLDMQERVLAREAEAAFNAALARLNTGTLRVKRNGTVDLGSGKGSYRFAKWEDMDAVIRPLMQREGFTLSFDTAAKDGGGLTVTGTLLHSAGHSRSASIPLALDTGAGRNNLQAMGSTLSYGKRYVAEMLLNIVREDDDDDGVRGGTLYITLEQAEQIEALIAESRADRVLFMRHFAVNSLLEIKAADYAAVVNALNAKLRRVRGGTSMESNSQKRADRGAP
jgi:hypothetical protein